MVDDAPNAGRVAAYLVTVGSRFKDLQHAVEVLFPDEDLAFGIHVTDPAIRGHDLDLLTAIRAAAKGADYVVGLVRHLRYYRVSPIIRFGHAGSHKFVSE